MKENNKKVKILVNMAVILEKVKNKKNYNSEDYFYIHELIDGYSKIKSIFPNSEKIEIILKKDIDGIALEDLIRKTRNQYGHIDKFNAFKEELLLHTKVTNEDINYLLELFSTGINVIFSQDLNNDAYCVMVNSKPVLMLFELIKSIIYNEDAHNQLDKMFIDKLKPFIDDFSFENSTEQEFDELLENMLKIIESPEIRNKMVEKYNEEIYNEFIKMLTEEDYSIEEAMSLLEKTKENT